MRLVLNRIREMELEEGSEIEIQEGFVPLKVLFCGVCRTDAKMWDQGQRDLLLPRVLGHEVVAQDQEGNHYLIWPGKNCGRCRFCKQGMENLCEELKIMGFDYDGGFQTTVAAPKESLVPIPSGIPLELASLAEPVACLLHGLEKLSPRPGGSVIIFGGGTAGLLCALLCQDMGLTPLVIEKSQEKIEKAGGFLALTRIPCKKETMESEFGAAINACDDPGAFAHCLLKLEKAGTFSFFSGLTKNKNLETNLINLLHYKELSLHGSYGCTKADMNKALEFIKAHQGALETIVEQKISIHEVPALLPEVMAGRTLKLIVDLQKDVSKSRKIPTFVPKKEPRHKSHLLHFFDQPFREIITGIEPVKERLIPSAQSKIDNKTKPLGSLGRLEELAIQLCLIQGTLEPEIRRKALLVFAGDHGVTEEGVSAYPSEVTYQMVLNFLRGGAAINVLCRHNAIEMRVVDIGVKGTFEDHPLLWKKKVRNGTRNFLLQSALTAEEATQAIQRGMEVFAEFGGSERIDALGLGDMGIGNTTASTAIICAITGLAPELATGRGTGVDNKALEHKIKVIKKALEFHEPDANDPLDVIQKVGGLEIAGIAGAVLAAAGSGAAVLLDGVISTAGGLIAYLINPAIKGYLVAGHRSVEPAQRAALSYMGLNPLLNLNMRLGEGTGAALAINLLEASAKIMKEMASFEEAGVSREKDET